MRQRLLVLILTAAAAWTLPIAKSAGQQPEPPASDQEQPRYFTTSFSLDDVNLSRVQTWLRRVGLEIPVSLGGEVSIQVEVDIPLTALTTGRLYRARGTVSARRLVIEGLEIRHLAGSIRYADGVATLEQLRFRIPSADGKDGAAGLVTGQATLQLKPLGDLTAEVSLDDAPLEPVLDIFPELGGLARGRVSGQVEASVALEAFTRIAAWEVAGRMTASRLQGYGITVDQAVAEARLQEGRLSLESVRAEVLGGVTQGSGMLRLTGEQPFSLQVNWADGDVEQLMEILPAGTLPFAARGEVAAAVAAEGTLSPLKYTATGSLRSQPLQLGEYAVPRIAFDYRLDTSRLLVNNLLVETPDGRITGSASLPFDQGQAAELALELTRVRLVPIADDLLGFAVPPASNLAGMLSGRFSAEVPLNAWRKIGQWRAQGQILISDLRALQRAGRVATAIRLENGTVQLTGVRAQLGGALLTGDARFTLAAPFAFSVDAELAGANLEALRELPPRWRPPVALAGLVNAAAEVTGGLNPLRLQGEASVAASELVVSTLQIPRAQARLSFQGAQFDITEFLVQVGNGQVSGSATVPLDATQALQTSLQWRSLEIGPWASALARIDEDLPPGLFAGTAGGRADLTIPAGTLDQPARWNGEGEVTLQDVSAFLWDFERVEAAFTLAGGAAEIRRFVAIENQESLTGSFTTSLTAPYAFSAELSWDRGDFRSLSQTAPGEALSSLHLAGRFDLSTRVSGTMEPWAITGQGSLEASDLQVSDLQIDGASLQYLLRPERLSIRNLNMRLYEGTAEGSVTIPVKVANGREADDLARGSVSWQGVQLGPLTGGALEGLPLSLRGLFAGELTAAVPLPRWSELAAWRAQLTFRLTELHSEAGQALGSISGRAGLDEDVLRYEANGAVLGGAVDLTGEWAAIGTDSAPHVPLPEALADDREAATAEPNSGRLRLQNVRLEQLQAVLPAMQLPPDVQAAVDLNLRYAHSLRLGVAAGRGEIAIVDLREDDRLLIERMQGAVRVTEKEFQVRDVTGRYAEGRLQLSATTFRGGTGPTSFAIALAGAEPSQTLAFWPDWSEDLDGRLDLRLRGALDRRWRMSCAAQWSDAQVAATHIGRWRLNLVTDYNPASRRADIHFRDVTGHWARGRVSGRGRMTVRRGVQLRGQARFVRLELQQLLRSLNISQRVGTGRISGTLTLAGRNMRELGDLTAALDAELANTSATAVPLMSRLQPFLAPVIFASTTFDQGQLKGRLSRGVFRIERFSLTSPAAQLYGTGNISTGGRLNLEVTANTGGLEQEQVLARTLLERLIKVSQPPLALLLQINEFLSDRVIHLQVTGTWRAPVIRIRPVRMLSEEVVRFFLQQAVR